MSGLLHTAKAPAVLSALVSKGTFYLWAKRLFSLAWIPTTATHKSSGGATEGGTCEDQSWLWVVFAASLVSRHSALQCFVTACKLGHAVTHALSALLTHSNCSTRSVTFLTEPLSDIPLPERVFLTVTSVQVNLLPIALCLRSAFLSSKPIAITNIIISVYFVVEGTATHLLVDCVLLWICVVQYGSHQPYMALWT